MSPRIRAAAASSVRRTSSSMSSMPGSLGRVQHLSQGGREALWVAREAELTAEEAGVIAGEGDRLAAEPLGHAHAAAVGHLALRLGAHADHDPGRRLLKRLQVGLVVGAADEVLAQERVVAVPLVLVLG